jgi:hypothetical protein
MSARQLIGPIPGDPSVVVGSLDPDASGYLGEEWFLSSTVPLHPVAIGAVHALVDSWASGDISRERASLPTASAPRV